MKTKLLLLSVLIVFTVTLSGCSRCGGGPGDNSNVNANTPTPAATPTPTPTATPSPTATPILAPTPEPMTGIPECDDLFAKFEAWAAEKNKNGSKAEKIVVAGLKISLIGPLKNKIDKMKPGDRDRLAGQCSLAAIQFERKQRALETGSNTAK